MKKTVVISGVFPPRVGGNGCWMWELYSRLSRGDFLVVADRSLGCEEFDRSHELLVIRVPLDLSSWGILGWRQCRAYYHVYAQLRQLVLERGIQCVHASNCLPEGFLAWLLHRRLGLPYMVYVHGEELNIASRSRELAWMTRRVYSNATLIVANSHNSARTLLSGWPARPERVHVMHPGVDTVHFRPAPRDREARGRLAWGDRAVILTVGRLQQRKGHEQIIRALPAVRERIPNVLYAIMGDGQEHDHLQHVVHELGLSYHVKFHGEVSNGELTTAYQQCDVFSLPNRHVDGDFEGFGIVFLEAQACGKPVIAGDSGGTSEAIHAPETGFIVRQDRPAELPAALIRLLADDSLREQMGQAGRQWAVTNFDWKALAEEASHLFAASMRDGVSRDAANSMLANGAGP